MSTAKVIQFRPKEVKESIVSNKKRGFTLVYKSLKDAPFYKNLERKSLWLHLLLQAAYDECRDSFNGNVITLQRGQLLGSVQTWANDCGVGYDSARRSIEYFESEGMIITFTKKGKSGFTVVTIANFESYQDAKKQENSADYNANYDAELNADYKPACNKALSDDSADYKTELDADYHAEASNNINNLKIKDLKDYGLNQADADSEPDKSEIKIPLDAAIHEQRGKSLKWGTAEDLRCAEWLIDTRAKAFTAKGLPIPKKPSAAGWANDVRMMRMTDGRTHHEIGELFVWVCRTGRELEFCQSPAKLREKWDNLQLRRANSERGVTNYQKPMSNIAAAQMAARASGVTYDDNEPL